MYSVQYFLHELRPTSIQSLQRCILYLKIQVKFADFMIIPKANLTLDLLSLLPFSVIIALPQKFMDFGLC